MTTRQQQAADQLALIAKQERELRAAAAVRDSLEGTTSTAPQGYSPTIVDCDGLPQAVAAALRSNGGIIELASLYALIDAWGECQRQYVADRALAADEHAVATPTFLPELFRWLARARFESPADEATAANFGAQMRTMLTVNPAQPIADVSAPSDELAAFESAADALDIPRNSGVALKLWQAARAAAPSVSAPSDEEELLALVPEREIMKLWGMCAYWGSVDTRVVPFARAVIRSALAARAAAPVSDQGESIGDDREFVRLLSAWDHSSGLSETQTNYLALADYIDSRPRSSEVSGQRATLPPTWQARTVLRPEQPLTKMGMSEVITAMSGEIKDLRQLCIDSRHGDKQ